MTLSILMLSIMTLVMLGVIYGECCICFIVRLSVVMLCAVMLHVVMLIAVAPIVTVTMILAVLLLY